MSGDEEFVPPPPDKKDRQTSFARAFFSAGTDPAVLNMMEEIDEQEGEGEILPESVVVPRSRPGGRRSSSRTLTTRMSSRSLMQSHMAGSTKAVAPPPPPMEGDTPKSSSPATKESQQLSRQPSWYRELLEQGVSQEDLAAIAGAIDADADEDTGDEADNQAKANDEMLAEQHRFLALIEAKKRVQERLGYDPDERRKEAKADPPASSRTRPCPLPTLKVPRWTPTKEFPYSVPPKEVPIYSERFIRQRVPRQPELQKGEVGSTAGPGQMLVRCLGCKVNLRVNMEATLVLCENCSVVCPASSTRK